MTDKFTNRTENIRYLTDLLGSQAELNRRIGKPPRDAYLSTIAGANPSRQCGPVLASKIERHLNLPPGWLSERHTFNEARDTLAAAHVNQSALSTVADAVQTAPAAQLELIPRDPIADFLGRPVAQLTAPADLPPDIQAGDLVLFDVSDNAARRPGLYVIDAAGVQTIGRLSVGFSGAVFTLGTESAPADTVSAAGRVIGILRKIP